MQPPKITSVTLIDNAKDSLAHAVSHLSNWEDKTPRKWKVAIREITHVIELLLKERLRREHPALIWIKVDDYSLMDKPTVGISEAADRLHRICNISLPKGTDKTLYACKRLRNRIEHCEFQLNEAEAKGFVGRLLSFLIVFSKEHLGIDFEKEFKDDKTWGDLIEIVEFRVAQAKSIKERFEKEEIHSDVCPSCGEDTFHLEEEKCYLCDHHESLVECEACGDLIFESESRYLSGPNDDDGKYFCRECHDDIMRADYEYDVWKDSRG